MNVEKWINNNTTTLQGKVVAITGTTGGLGSVLARQVLSLNASLLMLDRNLTKSLALRDKLLQEFPNADIQNVTLDMGVIKNVEEVCNQLEGMQIDYLILNAGVYNVPLVQGNVGYNNVFQVNFISPYRFVKRLMPTLKQNCAKVIAVGSIAHKFTKLDVNDVDYSNYKKASKIYGNSKRFLMFSLFELFKNEQDVSLAVVHPGVTLTNMTNHYPKGINWLVKIGIKLLFPRPKQATLCILDGLFEDCEYKQWIGPSRCDIWGKPKRKKLTTCSADESKQIFAIAESVYAKVNDQIALHTLAMPKQQ
ncbi:MAG: SDR family NAD(P)-dependent oxidoreductase [Clostridia bacterium]|nr:SDR family NAD(P)-dependent oxidoreductase [Clostridia bacterium]